jgi:hypothetical protein
MPTPYRLDFAAAADLTLTPEQLGALSAAVPAAAVSGDRCAARGMTLLDR